MIMRGGGDFNLAALSQFAVAWNNAAHCNTYQVKKFFPVFEGEAFILAHQAYHQIVLATHAFSAPRKVIPGQQIGQILPGQIGRRRTAARLQQLVKIRQALIERIRSDHLVMVAAETAAQNQIAFCLAHIIEVFACQQAQQGIANFSSGELLLVIFQLIQQYRDKVHHRFHLRMLLQVIGHIGVVLYRMQIDPRQQKVSAVIVAIIWLMHVPEKNKIDGFVHMKITKIFTSSNLLRKMISVCGVSSDPAYLG